MTRCVCDSALRTYLKKEQAWGFAHGRWAEDDSCDGTRSFHAHEEETLKFQALASVRGIRKHLTLEFAAIARSTGKAAEPVKWAMHCFDVAWHAGVLTGALHDLLAVHEALAPERESFRSFATTYLLAVHREESHARAVQREHPRTFVPAASVAHCDKRSTSGANMKSHLDALSVAIRAGAKFTGSHRWAACLAGGVTGVVLLAVALPLAALVVSASWALTAAFVVSSAAAAGLYELRRRGFFLPMEELERRQAAKNRQRLTDLEIEAGLTPST